MNVYIITVTNVVIKPMQKDTLNNMSNQSMKMFIITVTNVFIESRRNQILNDT